jgi:hypothetical protein
MSYSWRGKKEFKASLSMDSKLCGTSFNLWVELEVKFDITDEDESPAA